ncbi:MAG: glycosyltransferase family 2 protein [Firmicutes bacterium]|nr:glycosyltransferase family 2 protein [Bacillota bacterium]
MRTIFEINLIVAVCFFLCYSYQFFYLIIGIFKKPKEFTAKKLHRYAFLISARNEESVIANLIESINNQNYPKELIDIYVVADNCTDKTAEISRKAGANVYERYNMQYIGKGYALDYLLEKIKNKCGLKYYDGYFVFDADNLLDRNYVEEMNKVFDNGYRVLTSYRNSKNFESNWISSGYSVMFLREAKLLNNARMMLHTSCAISGTGFLVSSEIIDEMDGWKYFLLTEDIEFTVDNVIKGEIIGYCANAMFYDEQPVKFSQSWKQRMRWAKGFYQIIYKYGVDLFKSIFVKKSFSCYDMFMTITPGVVFSIVSIILNICMISIGLIYIVNYPAIMTEALKNILRLMTNGYDLLFILGAVSVITEWGKINARWYNKLIYTITFPLFMYTFIPIAVVALFKKVEWDPISHTITKTLHDIDKISVTNKL